MDWLLQIVVWLPRLAAADGGSEFCFTVSLAIVQLAIQFSVAFKEVRRAILGESVLLVNQWYGRDSRKECRLYL